VHILKQACSSLAEAHHKGLVHRDVKPANIFICNLGLEPDFVKVLDFGLVKAEAGALEGDAMKTADHVASGTPAYMAPETLTGAAIDAGVDIYALGCVGYWLLTGQLVFEADTALNVAIKHIHEAPVPPSQRSELEVPAELDALILSCLEKRPEARPRTGGELAQRLTAGDFGAPWTRERMERWWETHHLRARADAADPNPQLLQTLPV
jgi:serine/threonine-protein kinase